MGIKHSLVADSSKTITSSAWNADHIVDSTVLITNLNADLLDGYHATDLGPTHSHSISQVTIDSNVIPTSDLSFDLGSSSNKFSKAYIGTIYPTAIDNTVTILKALNFADGSSTIVVRSGTNYPNRLEISSPYGYVEIGAPNPSYSHFFTDRPAFWFNAPIELNSHLKPYHPLLIDLGDSSKRFRDLYLYNFVNFPIRKTGVSNSISQCGGINWYGLTDTHRIFVEEYSGTGENSRLVIQSEDNGDPDYLVIRNHNIGQGTKDIMEFKWSYIGAGTELRPLSDNSIDLGNSSYKWRTVYANTIVANTLSGTIDWSQINNKPSVTGYITPYAGDETEITITSTSDTSIKNANVVRLSSVLGTFSTMIFVMEGKVTSGNTLYLSAYLSGNLVATKTFTTTSYSLDYCQANTGGFGDGVYSVELKARVSGGTGYNRIFEVYLR